VIRRTLAALALATSLLLSVAAVPAHAAPVHRTLTGAIDVGTPRHVVGYGVVGTYGPPWWPQPGRIRIRWALQYTVFWDGTMKPRAVNIRQSACASFLSCFIPRGLRSVSYSFKVYDVNLVADGGRPSHAWLAMAPRYYSKKFFLRFRARQLSARPKACMKVNFNIEGDFDVHKNLGCKVLT
jgi:hypothetical protein